jgi:hypothetical protein
LRVAAEEDVEGLGDADGAEVLGVGIVFRTVVTGDVARDLLAELLRATVVRVGGATLLERRDRGFADVVRRDEVGLADAERDGVLHLGDDGEEVADARLGKVATCRATKRPEESMVRRGSRG